MANFRKSFNFRNGVQVDSNNFIVNPNGLVGIGTSIPAEALDLKGNARVSGLTTTETLSVGSGATFYGVVDVGDISLNSSNGVIQATSYRGDGSLLNGVVAIATEGLIINLSGLHTFESVGIGTSNQSYYLQIEGDPTETTGVGITNGIVRASGGFIGTVIGNVTGNVTGTATTATNLANAANITTGTINRDRLPASFGGTISFATTATNLADAENITTGTINSDRLSGSYAIDITGTATTATNLADAANITEGTINSNRLSGSYAIDITGTATTATNLANAANITGGTINSDRLPATITGNITGNAGTATTLTDAANIAGGTIDDGRLPDIITSNINATSGVSTFISVKSNNITVTGGDLFGNVTGDVTGTATTATNLANAANITTGTINSNRLSGSYAINITGDVTGDVTGTATTATNLADAANITGGTISDARLPDTITSNIDVDTGTSTFNRIGIQTSVVSADIEIQKEDSDSSIDIISKNNRSFIGLGKEAVGVGQSGAIINYGSTPGYDSNYSTSKSLDIINRDVGNFNFFLNIGATSDKGFYWHGGSISSELMTLTRGGNLGIGITNPTHKLNVQGISTFTDDAHFNSNVTIDGSLNINGALTGNVQDTSSDIILDVSIPKVNANVFTTTGISTFNQVSIASTSKCNNLVIGGLSIVHADLEHVITANNEFSRFFVDSSGSIGIQTTISYGSDIGVNCATTQALFSGVGIGTTSLRCAVDFADAGTLGITTHTYLVPPKVSTSNRNGIAGTITGAVIYNITDNKLQVYTGSTWETLTSS